MLRDRTGQLLRCSSRCSNRMSAPIRSHQVIRSQLTHSAPAKQQHGLLKAGDELDDSFTGLDAGTGLMTVAGFGSLLSERSARTTFPDLQDFRPGRLRGFRRVFAHTADIFFARGIAKPATGEISSLSCEPHAGSELVVSLFEVPFNTASIAAFIAREHEFRLLAVQPYTLDGHMLTERLAVLCGANTDAHYKATRCPPDEWARRWCVHGIDRVWRDDILPCRVYLRHCVLAAEGFCPEAYDSFLDATYLSDRLTTVRQYLEAHPDILQELPPPDLVGRYSG
ncbi:hypothetical protein COO60DRAFT_1008858 [Scenedesmus sp. NREL 46B-D3]|nr:hypothetical protein COO60DRAFT_1008858 [Scenedesmus sp. NREL 46B-D3]